MAAMTKEKPTNWVRVSLRTGLFGVTKSVYVWIDNAQVIQVWRSKMRGVRVEPGKHSIRCEIDRLTTNQIDVDLAPGESVNLYCRSRVTGWRRLISPYFILFQPNNVLFLERVEHFLKE